MTRFVLVAGLLGLVAAPIASAQPAPENPANTASETVTVTGAKSHAGVTPNDIAHDFVRTFAAPTDLSDAIARWQTSICPQFLGVAPNIAAVMEWRFRTIAQAAGAALMEKGCKQNVQVVVTPEPQAYLEALHKKSMDILGYHGAKTVTHPIQAWYVTGITDIRGRTVMDRDNTLALDITSSAASFASGNTAQRTDVGGWRSHPDATSSLLYVTILVDAKKTAAHKVGRIADYAAMIALSRTADYGDCQLMPSITNILSPACDEALKPDTITRSDLAYLRGVYRMDAGASLRVQQSQIAAEMAKALGGE